MDYMRILVIVLTVVFVALLCVNVFLVIRYTRRSGKARAKMRHLDTSIGELQKDLKDISKF